VIIIAIGANLDSPRYGPPRETCAAALAALENDGVRIVRRSHWYESAPVPPSDQPWYVNAAAIVETSLGPESLMDLMQDIERRFGRVRREANAARILDLDLIAYDEKTIVAEDGSLIVPHPRMRERAFVLLPMQDIAPDWIHPDTAESLSVLIAGLTGEGEIRAMPD